MPRQSTQRDTTPIRLTTTRQFTTPTQRHQPTSIVRKKNNRESSAHCKAQKRLENEKSLETTSLETTITHRRDSAEDPSIQARSK